MLSPERLGTTPDKQQDECVTEHSSKGVASDLTNYSTNSSNRRLAHTLQVFYPHHDLSHLRKTSGTNISYATELYAVLKYSHCLR